jgi:hypothetical protein
MMARSHKAERELVRHQLLADGLTVAQIAAEMRHRFGVRPRTAWRYALGWEQWRAVQEYRTANSAAIDESRISRWESWPQGGSRPSPENLVGLVRAFGHGCTVADLVDDDDLNSYSPTTRQLIDAARGGPLPPAPRPRQATIPAAHGTLATARNTHDSTQHHAAAMESFRATDRQIGGGHLYPAVAAYLSSGVSRDLLDASSSTSTFIAGAALSEMAGWMAHDGGNDTVAAQHFDRAVNLASVGSDPEVMVHLLASCAHLALHQHDPHRAASLTERGLHELRQGGVSGQVHARLLAVHARVAARLGDAKSSITGLVKAESALARRADEPRSAWVSRFDDASLAMEAARSLHVGGDHSGAREQAERVIALRPTSGARARALGQLMLATTHLEHGRADEAAALALDVVSSTRHLGSHVVVAQLRDLSGRLARTTSAGVVGDAVEVIRASTSEKPFTLTMVTPTLSAGADT